MSKIPVEDPKCIHLVYHEGTGYCHASIKDPRVQCEFADYHASSYFPPCSKYKKENY